MEEKNISVICTNIFQNPLILDSIFNHLPMSSLRTCRLVNWLWNRAATTSIRKYLKTRLLLCADTKCITDLQKLIAVHKNGSPIPFSRALLILDHLPSPIPTGHKPQEGEMELLTQISELFSSQLSRQPSETFTTLYKDLSPENKDAVKVACDLFSTYIDNLIVNMTLYRESPSNMEHWLRCIDFPNLSELSFHITRTSPDDLSHESLLAMMNSFPNLRSFGLRKLTKKGDTLMNSIMLAFVNKSNLCRVRNLSLEIFTDDKYHLEALLLGNFFLKRLSMIYLGGEVRFTEKIDLIKKFLFRVQNSLEYLYTHLPLFSRDQKDFPKLTNLKMLKVEKVYREFSVSQAQIFDFEFNHYFPKIGKIIFKDYDIWKNMLLKAFPVKDVLPCRQIIDISLPDLCFDAPLMERYLRKFPNLRSLSLIVSYVSRYQKHCSYCLVYAFLPHLKELNVSIFEVDIPMYDNLFTGISNEKCEQLMIEKRRPDIAERGLSIVMLKELEILRITSLHGNRTLGISDLSVEYGFLEIPSLRQLIIGASHISQQGIAQLEEKCDLTIWHKSICTCKYCRQSTLSLTSTHVPENEKETVMYATNLENFETCNLETY